MLEQYQDIMTIYNVAEALCIRKNRVYELLEKRAKELPNWKGMENPKRSFERIYPVAKQSVINRI